MLAFRRRLAVAGIPEKVKRAVADPEGPDHVSHFVGPAPERLTVVGDDDFNRAVFPVLQADVMLREGYSYPAIYRIDQKDRGVFELRIVEMDCAAPAITVELRVRDPAFFARPFQGQWHASNRHRVPTEQVVAFFSDAPVPDWVKIAKQSTTLDSGDAMQHVHAVSSRRIEEFDAALRLPGLQGITLLQHQSACLAWMIGQEDRGIGHDLWAKHGESVWHNALLDTFLPCAPLLAGGGILADVMGMGKTVTSLALIANSSVEGPTLVVVPVTLVPQWRSEATRMLPEARVVVYHGSRRVRDPAALAAATIVITTYEVAASDNTLWRRRHTGATPLVPPLAQVRWARIIADEAHRLRETYTARFAALQMIPARSRWCLTGTPVTLTVDDLYGLLVFLRYDHLFTPVSYRCGTAALWRDLTRRGTGVLREVLARTMWRFTDRAATIQCAIEHHHVPMDLAQAEADAYRAHLPERVRSLPVLTLLQTVGELRRLCNGETPDATRAAGPFCERLPRAPRWPRPRTPARSATSPAASR